MHIQYCIILIALLCLQPSFPAKGGGKGKGKGIKGLFPFPNLRLKSITDKRWRNKNASRIIESSLWTTTYRLGYEFHLICSAWGIPTPMINWFKDGNLKIMRQNSMIYYIRVNETVVWTKLEIQQATIADQGMYSCVAHNTAGSEAKVFKSEVE